MARNIKERYTVTATLEAQTAIHIGGAGTDAISDMSLARDGTGKFYIPGTSLAGVMLSWWKKETILATEAIQAIWGKGKDDNDDGHASRLIISDAPICGDNFTFPEIRDHVGLDRITGTASENIKFDRMVLPRGSCFDFSLELETDSQNNIPLKCLRLFLEKTRKIPFQIGGSTTRGLGEVTLKNCQITKIDFQEKAKFLESLGNITDTQNIRIVNISDMPAPEDIRKKSSEIIFSLTWSPKSVLFTRSSYDGIITDSLPLITTNRGKEIALLLPGSSIKGALRSHAEKILRSLLNLEAPPVYKPGTDEGSFTNQIKLPLINKLFGTVKKDKNKDSLAEKGCLSCPDRHANIVNNKQKRITIAEWQKILNAKDDLKLFELLNDHGLTNNFRNSYHVAIDRWTGGAKAGSLFQILQPENFEWDKLTIRLDTARIPAKDLIPAKILLLLTLNDLAQGDFALGFGAAKGFGRINISATHITGAEGLLETTDNPDNLLGLIDSQNLEDWQQIWQNWITANKERITKHNVGNNEGEHKND